MTGDFWRYISSKLFGTRYVAVFHNTGLLKILPVYMIDGMPAIDYEKYGLRSSFLLSGGKLDSESRLKSWHHYVPYESYKYWEV